MGATTKWYSVFTAFTGFLFVFSPLAKAQWSMPSNGTVFTQTEIPRVHILIDPDSLATLYLEENWYSDYEYQATMVFESSTNQDTLPLVGFRFRGNTSRDKQKKSFKISFNTYVSGRQYFGLEKLNLNAETNDPSLVRSRIGWDLLKEIDIPSSRSNHVEVYINGGYYGLYQNIEHLDEEFAESRFNSKVGNLYKCGYPADLNFISNNPDAYKIAPWGPRTYELKTNEDQDSYEDLAEFIICLNQANSSDLECGFHEYFNVYQYLKIAAFDVLTGNWDGYIYNQNNFYLYHSPLTDQFEYIPYDIDNTLGIDWLDRNWATRNIYTWSQTGAPRPLYNRLMDISAFRNIFSWHLQTLLNDHFGTPAHTSAINSLHEFITASALSDPFRPIDFGFSNDIFLNSLEENVEDSHVDFGILPYMSTRKSSAQNQLVVNSIAPIIHSVQENFGDFPNTFKVAILTSGPELSSLILNYSLGNSATTSIVGELVGGQFQFSIPLTESLEAISYQITAQGVNGLSRNAYCENRVISFANSSDAIFINEVMSSNQNSATDEAGQHEDWVELYQNSGSSISLTGYYLTDDAAAPTKWHLPAVLIGSGAFPLVWADEDLGDGLLHANFKISAGGEQIFLFQKTPNGLRLVDEIDLPALPSDYSFGRISDGQLPWILFEFPTPNASNGGITNIENREETLILPFPNPTQDIVNFGSVVDYKLFDLSGKMIANGKGGQLSLGAFANGIYALSINGNHHRIVKLSGN